MPTDPNDGAGDDQSHNNGGQVRPQFVTPVALEDLLSLHLPGRTPLTVVRRGSGHIVLTGACLRDADVRAGDLFAALPGTKTHGAAFISGAVANGARVILTDEVGLASVPAAPADLTVLVHPEPRAILGYLAARIYGDPSRSLTLIGITGTSGKTTTAYMVEAGLLAAGKSTGLIGTVETRINGRQSPSALTTPEAPQLQALLATMLEQGVEAVVMEVSSHALVLGRVTGSHFSVGAFTNLSQDHLDFHKNFDDYFAAKALLFDEKSPVHAASAVVCVDDDWGQRMAAIAGPRLAAAVSTEPAYVPAQDGQPVWRAKDAVMHENGSQHFIASLPDGTELGISLPIPGKFNEANALLAFAVLHEIGVPADNTIRGLGDVTVPGRLEQVDRGQSFLAVVDYAHKPAALDAVISTLRARSSGRIAVVFGAGGERDEGKRPLMGGVVARLADLVVVTDDNPRGEDPATIRAQVLAGARAHTASTSPEIIDFDDRGNAISYAVQWAQAGDIVLVAGKGHETGQIVDGETLAFDDRLALAAAIDRL